MTKKYEIYSIFNESGEEFNDLISNFLLTFLDKDL